jgi:Rrf2 family protein
MKLISRNTDYAVRSICYIAKHADKVITADELVKSLKIPRPFLRKILQVLNRKGILESHKGAGGGFKLARKASNVYLLDLVEAFQGPFKLNECFFRRKICPGKSSCCLKKKIDSIEDMVHSQLKSITISSIMKGD